ncbi:MAG TPA: tyrosine--tRNA ligase [Candidatus Norongarragalinales archaeon]|nr:tyrosine--tRNA ligase [Candidatus Norongarragalinales archaeon]
MDVETRLEMAIRPPTAEIVAREELKELLEVNSHPTHYIGLEISGKLHLGSLLINGFKVNDLTKAGFKTQVFLADWHSVINNKLEGDWEKIGLASKYYEEAFKFFCPGAKIVRGTELYKGNDEYWRDVISFSKHMTLARATRCLTIMGRSERDSLELAQYFYPSMQGIDIKHLSADVAHAGMDQRKIHMVAREVFPKLGLKKPIALHHHLIPGLTEPPKAEGDDKEEKVAAAKMSKSLPSSAIFIHDTEKEISDKLKKAYCPSGTEGNPVLEIAKYLIFHENKTFSISRDGKYGGDMEFGSYDELEKAYLAKTLHAMDLKSAVSLELNRIIEPIRGHFKGKENLLGVFEKAEITR